MERTGGSMTDWPSVLAGNAAAQRILTTALSAMPQVSLFLVDPDLRYRAIMGGAATEQGYDVDAVLGRTVSEVLPPEAAAIIAPMFERALAGEHFVEAITGSRSLAQFEARFAPAVDDGNVVGALAVIRDVTVERQAVAELAATDELHRMLMSNIGDAITLTAAEDARYIWVSPSAQWVTGWRPEDLVGRTVFDLVHPHDADRLREGRRQLFAGTGQTSISCRFRRPDESWMRVEATVRLVGQDRGPEAMLLTTIRDVSDRVALQEEVARATEMFELSFAAAPIGMALVDLDGRFVKVNDALCVLLGRDAHTLVGGTFQELTHPEDLTADLNLLRQVVAGERDGYRMEKRYLRPDGTIVWALLAVSVVRDQVDPRFFISQIEDITERKNALHEMQRLATTDSLTGLPNRLLLMDRLRHALAAARRDGTLVGVLFVDLDNFKRVNDLFGHDAGDELLRATADRMTRMAREGDSVTRLGGDEFVMLSERVRSVDDVAGVAERLRAELARPYTVFGHEVTVSVSIGVTAGSTTTGESLLREADHAMHAAKRSRHGHDRDGRVDVWTEAFEVLAHEQLSLHAALREGIPRGELVVHYQPIVALTTGAVTAYEALVRWNHPTLGQLRPGAFLEGTDHSRLGVLLGEHVLRQACFDAATWRDPVALHVNISARHLADSTLATVVRECLHSTGLLADRLVLEITESLVLAASPSTLASTGALAAMGVGLSLDDFGTGHSSVAALHRLPIDSFKIDQSFIADVPHNASSASLVEGLIGLGSHLDLGVIAEGVETVEQAEWLAARGCPHAQGYYFGHPSPMR
jgi:diguanylate cyclase (GGDEF)-like protein/PAS domain S-box-containing protein